jgi:uncharacterized protein YjbK
LPEEIEIEFKNLLTYDEFLRLIHDFGVLRSDFIEQTNHYFDTDSHHLKREQSALRIRCKKEKFILTLKQQKDNHILETHQPISEKEYFKTKDGSYLPHGEVTDKMKELQIPLNEIKLFGTLTTLRTELPYKEGILVLDENHYLGKIDYELEFESADYKEGLKKFQELLEVKNIPQRETASKIHRFFQEKTKQER